jgi:exodeoxyribonuclease VII large subunit
MNEISVSQLNNYIKAVFGAEEMLHNITVVGEIDGLSVRSNGVWFSLKDKDSTIQCVCWDAKWFRGDNAIKNGDLVNVRGTVDYWNKAGKINFTVHYAVKSGVGDLLEQFKKLHDKLKAEGLFEKKRELPKQIKRVGVITSKYGAVLHDIINVTKRRNKTTDIIFYPASVQGEAAAEIIKGVTYFSGAKSCDVLIVARGGGSGDDLAIFNREDVVRAIAECKIPVISAIGHETDWTLTDYIADIRAPTPSAAAELAVPQLVTDKDTVIMLYQKMRYALLNRLEMVKREVQGWANIISANNPMNILARGFAAVSKNGKTVKSVKEVKTEDELQIRLKDGIVKARAE